MPRTSDNYYRDHQIICNKDIQLWGHEVFFDAIAGIARDIASTEPECNWTESALAEKLGVIQQTVNAWISDIRARQKASRNTVILRLSHLGWPQEKIAETTGVTRGRVAQIDNNTNFGEINTLLSQGHDMDYIASH